MKKIGMVVAMTSELIPLLESQGIKTEFSKKYSYDIISFTIGSTPIVCVRSGVGEICAAAATQMLIGEFGCDVILNFGVVGALSEKYSVKSVVFVGGVVHYDFDTSPIDGTEVGRYTEFPATVVETDGELLSVAKKISPSSDVVICASGDKFVADPAVKARLHKAYGAEICEMESAGILFTCKRAGVPCLLVKAVSDGEGGAEEFKAMVDAAAAQYVDIIVELCKYF